MMIEETIYLLAYMVIFLGGLLASYALVRVVFAILGKPWVDYDN